VKLAKVEQEVDALLAEAIGWTGTNGESWLPPEVVADVRPRRGRLSPTDLVIYVDIYLRHCGTASRHPRQDAATELGVSDLTMRDYLSRAVQSGLFVRNGRGKKGGQMTPKALQLRKGT
jgi:hypothetical protein